MSKIKLIVEVDEEIFKKGFEGSLTDEERQSLLRSFGNAKHFDVSDDLISRSALKKAIKSYADDQYAENEYLGECSIMDIIDNAPPVVINCKDCDGYEAGYSAELNDAERPKGDLISRSWLEHNVLPLVDPETRIYVRQRLDNAPTVEPERPQGECKTCKHYKPIMQREMFGYSPRGDGHCGIRRMTQDGEHEINVNDDFYCKYYERGENK